MSTARDICTAALEYLGVVSANETPQAEDMTRVFLDLNDLVDSFSTDEYLIFTNQDEQFSLVAGTGSYAIGPSATFNTVRPNAIDGAWVRINSVDYPLVMINTQEYNEIGLKAIQTTIPQFLYYNPTFPTGTIQLWPVPSIVMTLNITSQKQLVRFATLDTAVSLPPGYARMLKWNLIVESAEAFGKTASAGAMKKAGDSKATLKRLNSPPLRMKFDAALGGNRNQGYSIYRDGAR